MTAIAITPMIDKIRQLAREGYGWEDIGVKLNISGWQVRPFVIRMRP